MSSPESGDSRYFERQPFTLVDVAEVPSSTKPHVLYFFPMNSSPMRVAVGLLVLAATAGTACKGGGSSDSGEGGPTALDGSVADDPPAATSQVIFEGRLEAGTDDDCDEAGPLFAIGSFTPATPIRDGEVIDGNTLRVTCAVASDGAGAFDVDGAIFLAGAAGGRFRVVGKMGPSGEQSGIDGSFSRGEGGTTYEQQDGCVVRYASAIQGVGPGRVWGEITCPSATSAGSSCQAIAQFRFENCASQ